MLARGKEIFFWELNVIQHVQKTLTVWSYNAPLHIWPNIVIDGWGKDTQMFWHQYLSWLHLTLGLGSSNRTDYLVISQLGQPSSPWLVVHPFAVINTAMLLPNEILPPASCKARLDSCYHQRDWTGPGQSDTRQVIRSSGLASFLCPVQCYGSQYLFFSGAQLGSLVLWDWSYCSLCYPLPCIHFPVSKANVQCILPI